MDTLIQEVAAYARAKDPNFQIWINSSGAEDMLTNSALVSTIDGAYEEQLFYQSATNPASASDVKYNVALLDNVTKAGKAVVATEYVSSATAVASVETQAAADGFGYYIANPNEQLDGVDTQGFASGCGSGSPPTVAITNKGGTTTSATQTITGTVDVADAGATVTVLDGTKSIGSATVASSGSWSATETLANTGSNVLTAKDTNASGTGTSNAVTYDLLTAAPTVVVTSTAGRPVRRTRPSSERSTTPTPAPQWPSSTGRSRSARPRSPRTAAGRPM